MKKKSSSTAAAISNVTVLKKKALGEGTLPGAIFRFRIFSNYFSQKFEKIKIAVRKSDNLTMYGNFCLNFH